MTDKKVLLEKLFQMKDALMMETTSLFQAVDSKFSQIAKIDEMIMEIAYPEIEVVQEVELGKPEPELPPLSEPEPTPIQIVPEQMVTVEHTTPPEPPPPKPPEAPKSEEKAKGLGRIFRRQRKPVTEPVSSSKVERDALLDEIDKELNEIKKSTKK